MQRTHAQNGRIHGLLGQLSKLSGTPTGEMKETTLGDICAQISGQRESHILDVTQANLVIAALEERVARYGKGTPSTPTPTAPRGDTLMTPAARKVLAGLYDLMGWDEPRQRGWSEHQCGHPQPRTLTEGDQVIAPLRQMVERSWTRAEELARVQRLQEHAKLDRWERETFLPDLVKKLRAQRLSSGQLLKLVEAERRCGVTPEIPKAGRDRRAAR